MGLRLEGLTKRYDSVAAVDGVTLSVERGEFFTLLGPSGCGKTTILRCVAGILDPDAGRITLNGGDITHRPLWARNVGIVFQSYALFPHLTVERNVAFGLEMRGLAKREIAGRVEEALAMVQLTGFAKRKPAELSGGQQQRVALARAVVIRPDLLLLDEPLSNLDTRLREDMRGELAVLQRRTGITTVLVTHDIQEAFSVSDRIAVMRQGKVEQIGTPADIYYRPATRFVANFVGPANDFAGAVRDRGGRPVLEIEPGFEIARPAGAPASGRAWAVVRPERVQVSTAPLPLPNAWSARIEQATFQGSTTALRARVGGTLIVAELAGRSDRFRPGDPVHVGWATEDVMAGPEA